MRFKTWLETEEQRQPLRFYREALGLPFGFMRKGNPYVTLQQAYQSQPKNPAVEEAYRILHRELDRVHGKHFNDFFTKVSQGDETYKATADFEPEYDMSEHQPWDQVRGQYHGNFDLHIKTSIPTFGELQDKKGHAIVKAFGDQQMKMLDIGGSEGSFARTISHMTGGNVQTDVLDPNKAMRDFYNSRGETPGSKYLMAAFLSGWMEDDGSVMPSIHADNHQDRYDIIHEAMAFQFINNNRGTHVAEAKRLMKPGGLLLTEEKLHAKDRATWDANEKFKDVHHKSRYYNDEKLAKKNKVVAFSAEKEKPVDEDEEAAVVGMANNMVSADDFEKMLKQNFGSVWQYWDSGNFKGYAASDSSSMVQKFLQALGPTQSKYSNVELPREVGTQRESFMARKFADWLSEASENEKGDLRSVIVAIMPDGWDDLTDREIRDKFGDQIVQAASQSGQTVTVDDLDDLLDLLDDWEFQRPFADSDYHDLC